MDSGIDPASLALQPWRCIPMYGLPMTPSCDVKDFDGQDKQHLLPHAIPHDPRQWSHQQVCLWLEWCVQQFALPSIDLDNFHMNGRALCLLTKSDFKDRVPRVGDVLFNTLHILVHKCAATPNVSNLLLGQAAVAAVDKGSVNRYWNRTSSSDFHSMGYVLQDNNSSNTSTPSGGGSGGDVDSTVILSPAPSTEGHTEKQTLEPKNGIAGSDEDEELVNLQKNGQQGAIQVRPTNLVIAATTTPHQDLPQEKSVRLLWDFLQQLLNDPEQRYKRCISWKDKCKGVFKIVDPHQLAYLWGMQKNHVNMNFDKMSRALRYYYRVKILQKEPGERHCYRFLRHPSELRNCKQRSLLATKTNINVSENEGVLDMSIKDEWNNAEVE